MVTWENARIRFLDLIAIFLFNFKGNCSNLVLEVSRWDSDNVRYQDQEEHPIQSLSTEAHKGSESKLC